MNECVCVHSYRRRGGGQCFGWEVCSFLSLLLLLVEFHILTCCIYNKPDVILREEKSFKKGYQNKLFTSDEWMCLRRAIYLVRVRGKWSHLSARYPTFESTESGVNLGRKVSDVGGSRRIRTIWNVQNSIYYCYDQWSVITGKRWFYR